MELDETDRKILYLLQTERTRALTHEEIGSRVGVSTSTVTNRIAGLEERGVLVDHVPKIDYEAAGIPRHVLFVCTAPIVEREERGEAIVDVHGVVNVRELLTGQQNLHVEVVCTNANDVESVARDLDDIGVEIESSEILRREHSRPFDGFGGDLDGAN